MTQSFKIFMCVFVLFHIFQDAYCIKCWDCRSDVDPKCAEPFDNSTIPITDCSRELKSYSTSGRPTMCRKTKERVNEGGGWLIIRDCAHFEGIYRGDDDNNMCFKTIGNDKAFVCFCSDKDGCNSSYLFTSEPLLLFLLVAIVPFIKVKLLN